MSQLQSLPIELQSEILQFLHITEIHSLIQKAPERFAYFTTLLENPKLISSVLFHSYGREHVLYCTLYSHSSYARSSVLEEILSHRPLIPRYITQRLDWISKDSALRSLHWKARFRLLQYAEERYREDDFSNVDSSGIQDQRDDVTFFMNSVVYGINRDDRVSISSKVRDLVEKHDFTLSFLVREVDDTAVPLILAHLLELDEALWEKLVVERKLPLWSPVVTPRALLQGVHYLSKQSYLHFTDYNSFHVRYERMFYRLSAFFPELEIKYEHLLEADDDFNQFVGADFRRFVRDVFRFKNQWQ